MSSLPSISAACASPRQRGKWWCGLLFVVSVASLPPSGAAAGQPAVPAQSPTVTATPEPSRNATQSKQEKILFYAAAARTSLAADKGNNRDEEARGVVSSATRNALWNEVSILLAHGGDYQGALAVAAAHEEKGSDGYPFFEVAIVQAQAGDPAGARETVKHINKPEQDRLDEVQGEIAAAEARKGDLKAALATLEPHPGPEGADNTVSELSWALHDGVLAGNVQETVILDQVLATIPADKEESIPHLEDLLALRAVSQARSRQFDPARNTLGKLTDVNQKVWVLRNIALQQAKADDPAGARETLATARALIAAEFVGPDKQPAEKYNGLDDPAYDEQAKLLEPFAATQVRIGDAEGGKKTIEFLKKAPGRNQYGPALAELAAFQAEAGDLTGAEETARANPEKDMRAKALGYVAQVRLAKGDADGSSWNVQEAVGLLWASKKDQNGSFLGARPVTRAMAKLGYAAEAVRLAKELEPEREDYRSIDSTEDVAVVVAQQQDTTAAQRWVEQQTTDPYKRAMYYVAMGLAFTKPDVIVYTNNTEDE